MNKAENERYRKKLLDRRAELAGDVDRMSDEALNRGANSSDLSTMPIHMADIGSDNYEQEVTLNLIEGENEELRNIDAALNRLSKGEYGVCEACDKKIPKARLNAIPYAQLCIKCKRAKELEEFGGQ